MRPSDGHRRGALAPGGRLAYHAFMAAGFPPRKTTLLIPMKSSIVFAVLLFATAALHGQSAPSLENKVPTAPDLGRKYQQINPIPPRYQWEHNGGYCGETSMISAGLYYGQYLSQFDARAIASPKMRQNTKKDGSYAAQLLLGVNDKSAAQALRLKHERLDTDDSRDLLGWIKSHVVEGHPVIMGVFNNEYRLYGKTTGGDGEYDHIVPVLGWGSNYPLEDGELHDDDVILISDNGLYTPDNNNTPPIPPKSVPYYFHYPLARFLKNRKEANLPKGNLYSLLDLPKYQTPPDKQNYGIAITGVEDELDETLPVRVSTSANYEAPFIASDSNKRPTPMAIKLTIHVSGLDPSKTYHVYHYTDEKEVPRKHFRGGSPWKVIRGSNGVWKGTMKIRSDQKAFFRAVEASDENSEASQTPQPGDRQPLDATSLF